jgi:hypothetical protein
MKPRDFCGRHYLPEVILQYLRWYLRYPISYRNLEEMIIERGVEVDHTTLYIDGYKPIQLSWLSGLDFMLNRALHLGG